MRLRYGIAAIGVFVALGAARGRAQDAPTVSSQPAPFTNVFISVGNAFTNVDALNIRFDSARYDAIAGHGFSLGAGGYFPYGRAVFGAEYHAADFGYESTDSGRTNKLSSHYWMLTAGYALYTTWHFNVIGYLGVGEGTTQLTVMDPKGGPTVGTSTPPLFDQILDTPGYQSVLTGSYSVFQPALGVDYLMLKSDHSHVGVTFGIRMGTTISPHRTTWTYEGQTVLGSPDAGPVGSFVRLTLGIGGFRLEP
jgi:hypothetical protein